MAKPSSRLKRGQARTSVKRAALALLSSAALLAALPSSSHAQGPLRDTLTISSGATISNAIGATAPLAEIIYQTHQRFVGMFCTVPTLDGAGASPEQDSLTVEAKNLGGSWVAHMTSMPPVRIRWGDSEGYPITLVMPDSVRVVADTTQTADRHIICTIR